MRLCVRFGSHLKRRTLSLNRTMTLVTWPVIRGVPRHSTAPNCLSRPGRTMTAASHLFGSVAVTAADIARAAELLPSATVAASTSSR